MLNSSLRITVVLSAVIAAASIFLPWMNTPLGEFNLVKLQDYNSQLGAGVVYQGWIMVAAAVGIVLTSGVSGKRPASAISMILSGVGLIGIARYIIDVESGWASSLREIGAGPIVAAVFLSIAALAAIGMLIVGKPNKVTYLAGVHQFAAPLPAPPAAPVRMAPPAAPDRLAVDLRPAPQMQAPDASRRLG